MHFKEENKVNLAERLKELMDKVNISQAKLAKKLDVSTSALSQWINGKYDGNVEELESKINKFINLEESKIQGEIPKIPFVSTSVAVTVFKAANYCHTDYEIGIVYGEPGLGKTTAIKQYASNNTGVIIIKAEENTSMKNLAAELYEKLGLTGQTRLYSMKKEILAKLKNSGWLVIVDESEFLKVKGFTFLRGLHDDCENTFGLLFCGTEKLYNNLLKLKGDFAYLTSRIGYRFSLEKLKQEDVTALVESVIPDYEIAQEIFSRSNGNARTVVKIANRSLRLAKDKNIKIDKAVIKSSITMLIA